MPIVKVPDLWPSPVNPCHDAEHRKKDKAPLWGVHGYATRVCAFCVYQREKENGSREAALDSFLPDYTGAPIK